MVGAAWVSDYDPVHDYYAGVGEATLYVDAALPADRERAGPCSRPSPRAPTAAAATSWSPRSSPPTRPAWRCSSACGYRRVGTHRRHGELRGEWIDVVVVERLLA